MEENLIFCRIFLIVLFLIERYFNEIKREGLRNKLINGFNNVVFIGIFLLVGLLGVVILGIFFYKKRRKKKGNFMMFFVMCYYF